MKRTVFIAIDADETDTPGLLWHVRISDVDSFSRMLTLTHEHSGRAIAHFWAKERLLECAKRLGAKIDWDRPIDDIMRNPTGDKKVKWEAIVGGIANLVKELDGLMP